MAHHQLSLAKSLRDLATMSEENKSDALKKGLISICPKGSGDFNLTKKGAKLMEKFCEKTSIKG